MKEKGYEVKVLDLIDMEKSHCWGTLRKEGAPRWLLYLSLISS